MAFDIAKEHLGKMGLGGRIHTFEVSSATVELAARAVGCEPARIAKTLSFMVQGSPILVVAAGDAKVDNHKYKEQFGAKAKMLSPDEVAELVGHDVGGVCPFGIKDGVKVYLDESLKRFPEVFPACGSQQRGAPDHSGTGTGFGQPGMGGCVQGVAGRGNNRDRTVRHG